MNINQLAKRIAAEIRPDEEGEMELQVSRSSGLGQDRGLRRTSIEQLKRLRDDLARWIPNDFDFCLVFDDGEFEAFLKYEDGPRSVATTEFPFAFDSRLSSILRAVDWDDARATAIAGLQNNDRIIEENGLYQDGFLIT